MSGHNRWWIEHPEQIHPVDEIMIQHVQGYILAMEDVLRDIEFLRVTADSDADIIEGLEAKVDEYRCSAARTLDYIYKKVNQ